MPRLALTLIACVVLGACGGSSSPTGPSATAAPPSNGPRILLAGNSSAYFVAPLLLPDVLDHSNIDGTLDFWLQSSGFATAARTMPLSAFVFWGGAPDIGRLDTVEYATKLRALIALARSANPALPVRILEIQDTPNRAQIREAQRQVSADPNVQMIPTADLPVAADGHLMPEGYQAARDRIYRSLGR